MGSLIEFCALLLYRTKHLERSNTARVHKRNVNMPTETPPQTADAAELDKFLTQYNWSMVESPLKTVNLSDVEDEVNSILTMNIQQKEQDFRKQEEEANRLFIWIAHYLEALEQRQRDNYLSPVENTELQFARNNERRLKDVFEQLRKSVNQIEFIEGSCEEEDSSMSTSDLSEIEDVSMTDDSELPNKENPSVKKEEMCYIDKPALGRMAKIGGFYDARWDTFVNGNVFSKDLPLQCTNVVKSFQTSMDFKHLSSVDVKELLKIDDDTNLSQVCGLLEVHGAAKFIETVEPGRKERRWLHYQCIQTDIETLDRCKEVSTFVAPERIPQDCTHIVVGVTYGCNSFVDFCLPKYSSYDEKKYMESKFQEMLRGREELQETFQQLTNQEMYFNNVAVSRIFDDIYSKRKLESIDEMFQYIKEIREEKTTHERGRRGVPITYKLLSVKEFARIYNFETPHQHVCYPLSDLLVQKMKNFLKEAEEQEQRLHDVLGKCRRHCDLTEELQLVRKMECKLASAKEEFLEKVKQCIPIIRGSESTNKADELFSFFTNSILSREEMDKVIEANRNMFDLIDFMDELQKQGIYLIRTRRNYQNANETANGCFLFFPAKYLPRNNDHLKMTRAYFLEKCKQQNWQFCLAAVCDHYPDMLDIMETRPGSRIAIVNNKRYVMKDLLRELELQELDKSTLALPNKQNRVDVRIQSCNPVNILILGDLGVRKTTFLNLQISYLIETVAKEKTTTQPAIFNYDSTEELQKPSITKRPRTYKFSYSGRDVTITDTPGVGNVDLLDYKTVDLEVTLQYICNLQSIGLICFLLPAEETRLDEQFDSYFKEFIAQFDQLAESNIAFCLTKTLDVNFQEQSFIRRLNERLQGLQKNRNVTITADKHNVFIVDNLDFCLVDSAMEVDNDNRKSAQDLTIENRLKTTRRLIDYAISRKQHSTKLTSQIYYCHSVMRRISELAKHICLAIEEIYRSIDFMEKGQTWEIRRDKVAKMKQEKNLVEKFLIDVAVFLNKNCILSHHAENYIHKLINTTKALDSTKESISFLKTYENRLKEYMEEQETFEKYLKTADNREITFEFITSRINELKLLQIFGRPIEKTLENVKFPPPPIETERISIPHIDESWRRGVAESIRRIMFDDH